eukprot:499935-Pleurochrysis_carterae.AAC.1
MSILCGSLLTRSYARAHQSRVTTIVLFPPKPLPSFEPSPEAHLFERARVLVREVAYVDVVARGERELAPVEQLRLGVGRVLREVAEPAAHELRREDAVVVPARQASAAEGGGGWCSVQPAESGHLAEHASKPCDDNLRENHRVCRARSVLWSERDLLRTCQGADFTQMLVL